MTAPILDIALPLLCAVAAGGLLGLDRERRGRAAGFRTHILVCLTSAALMLAPAHQELWMDDGLEPLFRTDPTRMAQGIMTGIGFLGAGVIYRHGLTVQGLTTAASLWVTAGLGILFGLGFYSAGWMATGASAAVLVGLHWVDHYIPGGNPIDARVRYRQGRVLSLKDLNALLAPAGCTGRVRAYRLLEGGVVEQELVVRSRRLVEVETLAGVLRSSDAVGEFDLHPR